jgi:hypothetical protein
MVRAKKQWATSLHRPLVRHTIIELLLRGEKHYKVGFKLLGNEAVSIIIKNFT